MSRLSLSLRIDPTTTRIYSKEFYGKELAGMFLIIIGVHVFWIPDPRCAVDIGDFFSSRGV